MQRHDPLMVVSLIVVVPWEACGLLVARDDDDANSK